MTELERAIDNLKDIKPGDFISEKEMQAEIDRLTARVRELERALEKIAATNIAGYVIRGDETPQQLIDMIAKYFREFSNRVAIARAALEGKP